MAWQHCFSKIVYETDSAAFVRLVNSQVEIHHLYNAAICEIRELLSRDWEVSLVHVFREANFCANFLARAGSAGADSILLWQDPRREYALFLLLTIGVPTI